MPSEYLNRFGDTVLSALKRSIDDQLNQAPFEYPAEVINESHSHLCNCRQITASIGVSQSLDADCAPLRTVQKMMTAAAKAARHTPIVVVGADGVGKSTLLSQIFTHSTEWLVGGDEVIRIVRHIGQSPSSSYPSELLRNLCLHISLVYDFETSTSISFELSALSIWFQDLLKMIETSAQNSDLVILLDDLHLLRSAQTAAILGWFPWNLPANVHLVCSVSERADSVLSLLRSRISNDNFVRLSPIQSVAAFVSTVQCNLRDQKRCLTADQINSVRERLAKCADSDTDVESSSSATLSPSKSAPAPVLTPLFAHLLSAAILSQWESYFEPDPVLIPCDIPSLVDMVLSDLEESHGAACVRKICTFLTCTRFGLREAELVELVMAEDAVAGDVNVWLTMKERLLLLCKEYYVLGRIYINWKTVMIAETISKRYLTSDQLVRETHFELATAFHLGFREVLNRKYT